MISTTRKNGPVYLVACIILLFSSYSFAQKDNELRSVIASGLGEDVADAAQNAAQNALTEVVGSFLDATEILEKKAEIQSGIRKETKTITTDIKEYSQGSIKSFEILDAVDANGLIKVTARVTVRIEDFKNYVRKLAHTEGNIDGDGLFAQASLKKKQSKNKISLLHDNVLEPLLSGEVLEFNIGKPVLYENAVTRDSFNLDSWAARTGKEDIVGFPVHVTIKKEFIENLKNTLDHIANKKEEILLQDLGFGGVTGKLRSLVSDTMVDLPVIVNTSSTKRSSQPTADVYVISDVQHKLFKKPYGACIKNRFCKLDVKSLEISLKDAQGEILQSAKVTAPIDDPWERPVYIHTSNEDTKKAFGDFGHENKKQVGVKDIPWMMGATSGSNNMTTFLFIAENRSFWVFMKATPDALKNAKSISVSLVN